MKKSGSVKIVVVSVASILITGAAISFLLASSKVETNVREVKTPLRKVETIIPEFQDIPLLIQGNGIIESAGSINIYSSVSGKVVYSLNNLSNGTSVQKGDILLKIDSRQIENSLFLARSELIKSVASLIPQLKAGSDQKLYQKWNQYLNGLNFISEVTPLIPEIEGSREKLLISTSGIYSGYCNVKNMEIQSENHTIISPFNGYISGKGVLAESYVQQGQELMTLVNAVNMKVSVPLTVDDLKKIDETSKPSARIYSTIGNKGALEGKMVNRDMLMDRASQMVNVFIEFDNPDLDPCFAPGNYIDVVIEGQVLKNSAAIPRHVVMDNSWVYTYDDKILGREEIKIRAVYNETVYIDETLPEGTEIITTILQKPLLGMELSLMEKGGFGSRLTDRETGSDNEKDS